MMPAHGASVLPSRVLARLLAVLLLCHGSAAFAASEPARAAPAGEVLT